jgi:hypothetical protein
MLLLQFFTTLRCEAKAPALSFCKGDRKEARFSKTTTQPVAEALHRDTNINTPSQLRRHGPTGSLALPTFLLYRASFVTLPGTIRLNDSFCIPIALRLLFPGHYFW